MKTFGTIVVPVVAAALLATIGQVSAGLDTDFDSKTDFDYYVLAQTWPGQLCHSRRSWKGCEVPHEQHKTQLTIHGLWPNQWESIGPFNCPTDEQFSLENIHQIGYSDVQLHWPNFRYPMDQEDGYEGFWEYEWQKHGTCSGLSHANYTVASIMAHQEVGTPSILSENVGKKVLLSDLEDAFGGPELVSLVCSAGRYLKEVRTCWSKTSSTDTAPGERIVCPPNVKRQQNCHFDEIQIDALGSSYRKFLRA